MRSRSAIRAISTTAASATRRRRSFRRISANWMLVAPTAAPITSAGSQPQPGVPSHSACAVIETSISASQPNASRGGAAKPRKAIA